MTGGVALVAMPWASPDTPSIQVGLLTAALVEAKCPVTAHSLHLEAAGFFAARGIPLADFEAVCRRWWSVGLGEWIFAPDHAPAADYLAYLDENAVPDRVIAAALAMRAATGDFLAHAAAEILATEPRLVGFTTTFAQTLPSLALAAALKRAAPEILAVFGGANCDGPLGPALLATEPVVDVVVQGRAESLFPALAAAVIAGEPPPAFPGVLQRDPEAVPALAPRKRATLTPDYSEYFARLKRSGVREAVLPRVRLVLETARGCWWGERQHCKFCGLNGSAMAFDANPADRVLDDIRDLAERHQRTEFDIVDNILDPAFFDTVLPELALERRKGHDYRFFWEIKSTLTPEQVRLLRAAGVQRIQPGIESLSTRILRLMKKGVSALENVRLLAFAASNDLTVTWNIIYGIPGETEDDYREMAAMIPALVHLKPPGLARLQVQRFSPYFDDPAAHGLTIAGPARYYRHLYGDTARLLDLAYVVEHAYRDGYDPERAVAPLRQALAEWDRVWSPGKHASLRYERGPGFLRLIDRRPGLAARDILLDRIEADLYLAARTIATPAAALRRAKTGEKIPLTPDEVGAFFDDLGRERLMLREGNRYLALALPLTPDEDPPFMHTPRWKHSPAHAR